jgi:hypothetical protein
MQSAPCRPGRDPGAEVEQSRWLIVASRQLLERGKVDLKTSLERLDRARNALQVSWFLRALHERRHK